MLNINLKNKGNNMNFKKFLIEKNLYKLDEKKIEIDYFSDEDDFIQEEPEVELSNHDKGIIVAVNILTEKFKEVFETTHDSFISKCIQIGKESVLKAYIKKVLKNSDCKYLKTFISTNADEILEKLIISIDDFLSDNINKNELKRIKNQETAKKSSITKAMNKSNYMNSLKITKEEAATIEAALGK